MARRITKERVQGFIGGSTVLIIIGLFSLINFLGVATLEGNYSANEYCGGDTVCFLEMNQLCFNEDVFVYPMNGAAIINAQPLDLVDEVHLYRSWGKGWREIPLNKTCQSTWCGAKPKSTTNKFSYAFRKDKCYDLRIEVTKPLNSTISWSINPEGVWLPLADQDKLVFVTLCTEYSYNYSYVNCTDHPLNTTCHNETKTINYTSEPCVTFIDFEGLTIDYASQGYNCASNGTMVICDSKIDGNGDAICQLGETCCTINIDGEIQCLNDYTKAVFVERLEYDE